MCPLMSGSCGAGGSMIFDTDVLIWFLRGDGAAARLIESQSDRAISMISAMELLQGARSRAEIKTIHQFIQQSDIRLVPVNESISHVALSLIEAHALAAGLRVADALIAATAREGACSGVASRGCADCRHRSGGGHAARDRQCAPLQGNRRAGSESVPAGGGVNLWAAFAFFPIR